MLQTLFSIPSQIAGVPLVTWLFGILAVVSVFAIVRMSMLHGLRRAIAESWTTILITGVAIWILPQLMETGGLPIRGYGMMLLTAVASGVGLSIWRAQRIGFDPEIILSLAMWLFVAGIVGARMFYVIEYWHTFTEGTPVETLKAVLNVTKGGLVVYGCMLAGGAALAVFVYKHRLPGLVVADLIIPGVVLGMAIGRIGCFLNGCCYGGACELPWAVRFPAGSPPYMDQLADEKLYLHGLRFRQPWNGPAIIDALQSDSRAERQDLRPGDTVVAINGKNVTTADQAHHELLEVCGEGAPITVQVARDDSIRQWKLEAKPDRTAPIHPTQLYSAIDALLLCLFLLAYDSYRQREGELMALALTLHPISRFLLEIIRIDESPVFGTSMSISQNISIGVLIGAVVCWYVVLSRPKGLWNGFRERASLGGGTKAAACLATQDLG